MRNPIACPACGPRYALAADGTSVAEDAIQKTAQLLCEGRIVAVKGIGGYHLACDARNARAVGALRERKFRKEKPFAVMPRTIDVARLLAEISPESEALLTSTARPIVLVPAKVEVCRKSRRAIQN